MKFKGKENQLVSMKVGDLRIKFDNEGILDLDSFLQEFSEKVLIPRISKHFPTIEEPIEEPVEESIEEPDKIHKCKKCNAEFTNKGEFLAHCRNHKKEGVE